MIQQCSVTYDIEDSRCLALAEDVQRTLRKFKRKGVLNEYSTLTLQQMLDEMRAHIGRVEQANKLGMSDDVKAEYIDKLATMCLLYKDTMEYY